ncbi:MAG: hypothetical protein IJX63_03165 [Lachnospiraceae bacterium]|nr:hypothetical protein [Lachnospiraceae bacterium]
MRIEDSLAIGLNPQVQGVAGASQLQGVNPTSQIEGEQTAGKVQGAKKTECQTCKERKYQDGSDEMVSFKAAAHISPEDSASKVRAHEQEHVSNAYKKAAQMDGKVLQASVRLQTAVCPECGRSYVAGGTTSTKIQYKEDNPYDKNNKALQAEAFKGNHVDEEL